jgi:hypothetical protein
MFQLQLFFLLHCDEWDRVVALPRHKFVTGATLLQLGRVYSLQHVITFVKTLHFHWRRGDLIRGGRGLLYLYFNFRKHSIGGLLKKE